MKNCAMDTLLSADDVRSMLGVSRRTFEAIVARKEAPPHLMIGRQRRWRRSDVAGWIDSLAEEASERRRHASGPPNQRDEMCT
jgi:excisionase family DNA binding protein